MGEMHLVQIDKVIRKTYENKPAGKNYTVHQWEVSGYIDGEPSSSFEVKTLSDKIATAIAPGWEGQCAKDEFKGHIAYVVPTPKRDGFGSSGPSPQGTAKPASGGYTRHEYEILFLHAHEFCRRLVNNPASPEGDESLSRLMATYLIGAQREGIKIGGDDVENRKPAVVDARSAGQRRVEDEINEILATDFAGQEIKIDMSDLVRVYVATKKNRGEFVDRLAAKIDALAAGTLPF